jgi:ABC-type nitrate/sulfonate/bicarbonate transport system permease component
VTSLARARPLGVISFVVVFTAWELAGRTHAVNTVLLPPPSAILPALWHLFWSGAIFAALGQTLALLFAGYAIGCGLGIVFGLAMGWSRRADNLLEPLFELFRPIPIPALLPPLFLFLGFGVTMKTTVVALGAFFPVLINTIQGVRGVDQVALDTARTFRCPPGRILLKVVLPSALPMVLTGMRVSLGLGLILVVLAEMLAGQGGLGYAILDMQRSFEIADMYAWIIVLALIGLGLNAIFVFVEAKVVPWRTK